MSTIKVAVRYFVLVLGLFFMGLGISLTAKSGLGTSPIASLPYVLSIMLPLTLGQFNFLLSLIFLLVQIALQKKNFPKKQYMQLLVSLLFGFFIDMGMYLFAAVHPHIYAGKIAALLLGSMALALGIYLQVIANVIINPGEGAVKAIAGKMRSRFGNVKILFDSSLAVSATILSLCVFGSIRGIREGTILSTMLVGCIVNAFGFMGRRIGPINEGLKYLADAENCPG